MDQLTVKSPLLPFKPEKQQDGPKFLLKHEFLQPGGSFKSRGISHLIKTTVDSTPGASENLQVYTSSGGNAGLAAARACATLNVSCVVVVPKSTKKRMIGKIEAAGAKVIVYGNHWKEADTYVKDVLMKSSNYSKKLYVHPFDHPVVWEGHSFMIDEIMDQLEVMGIETSRVKGIVCSVGGGGLFNGVVTGLERHGLADKIPIYAMETKGCDVLNKSLLAGEPIVLDSVTSVATSLGSTVICQTTFDKARSYSSRSFALEDGDVVETCLKFMDETAILVEPACGAAVHTCYHPEIFGNLTQDDIIIIILCGGSCNTYDELKSIHMS